MRIVVVALALCLTMGIAPLVKADDLPVFQLSIKDHRYDPPIIEIPANTKVKLVVRNLDPTPEEFESFELKREKIVAGGAEIIVFIGPLGPGTYPFFGDFNQATAQGKIVAK
jgi:hypothetical protein